MRMKWPNKFPGPLEAKSRKAYTLQQSCWLFLQSGETLSSSRTESLLSCSRGFKPVTGQPANGAAGPRWAPPARSTEALRPSPRPRRNPLRPSRPGLRRPSPPAGGASRPAPPAHAGQESSSWECSPLSPVSGPFKAFQKDIRNKALRVGWVLGPSPLQRVWRLKQSRQLV